MHTPTVPANLPTEQQLKTRLHYRLSDGLVFLLQTLSGRQPSNFSYSRLYIFNVECVLCEYYNLTLALYLASPG